MGYDIYIGETVWAQDQELGQTEPEPLVLRRTLREAPAFPNDELTGKSNSRHPSYSGWANFCHATRLYDLFFDRDEGLMREHPGYTPLTRDHLEVVQQALAAWHARYPEAAPGFGSPSAWIEEIRMGRTPDLEEEERGNASAHLARLMWLEWWMRWALAHCGHPAIYNH